MIEYPKVSHKIPAVFARKIELDQHWAAVKAAKVVSMAGFIKLRSEMLLTRDACVMHVQKQKGGIGGATV